MEVWVRIGDFPRYSVSNLGQVRNDRTSRILVQSTNQGGHVYTGMMRDGKQYKASVARMVALAFLDVPEDPRFNTPIHLDGDRWNNRVDNLLWRPMQFAVLYYRQFEKVTFRLNSPVEEVETGEWFPTSFEAATRYGLLEADIAMAVYNETEVFPTNQRFRKGNRYRFA